MIRKSQVCGCVCGRGRVNRDGLRVRAEKARAEGARTAIAGHIFRLDFALHRRVTFAKLDCEVEIIGVQGVEAEVGTEAGEVVGINEVRVGAMNNIERPDHEAHLHPKYDGVVSVVGEDEAHCITVGDKGEALAEQPRSILVDTPVRAISFTEMRVKARFHAAGAAGAKVDGAKA